MYSQQKIVGLIPSRLKSTRLPGKPLKLIEGLPMIVHVYKRAQLCSDLDALYVVTDSIEIRDVIEANGGKVIMTSDIHQTGSDRIAQAAQCIDADIIINIQGDEALVKPEHISIAAHALSDDYTVNSSILISPCYQRNAPNEIKVVMDKFNRILYFSRNDIPSAQRSHNPPLYKIYCIVTFRKQFLLEFSRMEQTPLEKIEFNEYLRILENGYAMKAIPVEHVPPSVDDENDLELVRKLMRDDPLVKQYSTPFNAVSVEHIGRE